MHKIPLSIGSKLELAIYFSELWSLPNFRILPRTLTHLSAYACIAVHYIYVYIILPIYNVHDRGAKGFALQCLHCYELKLQQH